MINFNGSISLFNNSFKFPKINFGSNKLDSIWNLASTYDGFISNPICNKIASKTQIEMEAVSNPKIKSILAKYNLPIEVNYTAWEDLKSGHLNTTRIAAAKIYSNLPKEMQSKVSLKDLQEAALLHDCGKMLIPEKVLNKKGKLNEKELDIMHLHSELGYEMLKNKGVNENVLNMIKYHHQNKAHNGYPQVQPNYEHMLGVEILSVADKFSALTEKRAYKSGMSNQEALSILRNETQEGVISSEVFEALEKAVA